MRAEMKILTVREKVIPMKLTLKGTGGSLAKMRFLLILIASMPNFQALFTELKKLFPLASYRTSNFQKTAKSYTFWGFSKFQCEI